MEERPKAQRRTPTRTCVGCGLRDSASDGPADLLRLVVGGGEVAFDLSGGAFGRGAHVHPRIDCLVRAPRGLARAMGKAKDSAAVGLLRPSLLGERLVEACWHRMPGLLLAAHRLRAVTIGSDAARDVLSREAHRTAPHAASPLAIVASDAGSVASTLEVTHAAACGRAIVWGSKDELGALLGERSVAICAVRHEAIAAELKKMRALADSGAAATREGAECSRRPEAR